MNVQPEARPMRSLITEGVVIVLSILLAFMLDASWDSSRERREAKGALDALAVEFTEVQAELDRTLDRNESVIRAADEILGRLRQGEGRVRMELLGDLLRRPTMSAPELALATLSSGGGIDRLPDRRLRELLVRWTPTLQDVRDEELIAERFVFQELIPYLNEVTDATAALYVNIGEDPEGFAELPVRRQMLNLVDTRRYLAASVLSERDRVGIESMVREIRAGLPQPDG